MTWLIAIGVWVVFLALFVGFYWLATTPARRRMHVTPVWNTAHDDADPQSEARGADGVLK